MVNLPATDDIGHMTGGIVARDAMKQAIKNADKAIGRLLEEYRAAGMMEKTIFVVTSDHGMIPNFHNLDDTPIREAVSEYKAQMVVEGKGVHIWVKSSDRSKQVADKIAAVMGPEVLGVYYKTVDVLGAYQYIASKVEAAPNAFDYLLSTYACPSGPDISLFLKENTVFSDNPFVNNHGSHTEATWSTQHIPMIIAGPGVKKGVKSLFPARPVDIVPTVLSLAGITPQQMDGVVLADCMLSPASQDVEAQKAIEPKLKKCQDELRSLTNIRQ